MIQHPIRLILVMITLTISLTIQDVNAQFKQRSTGFTRADTLRGSNGPERSWWDVIHYGITVEPDYMQRSISGMASMKIKVLISNHPTEAQIDLQEPMGMDSIFFDDKPVSYRREGHALFIQCPQSVAGSIHSVTGYFSGKPRRAVNPPWDGGWIWKKDEQGNPWMSVACQGLGASVWYPCKDYQGDEPDEGATLRIIVPDSLTAVGNGKLVKKEAMGNNKTCYEWQVKNPINNYNIVPYIGKYASFSETYQGEKGPLDMQYWVMAYNMEKAKKQFTDASRMMKAFEYWFGPYPFYEDGFKLVEAPHLGMEHQSAIAYGNGYMNGYLGSDLSSTGWGLKWDFIIVHESGHEWFANNITTRDIADMWVHEGFTNYSETLFTEYYYGKEAGNDYVIGSRKLIRNDKPIIGIYGVNKEGSGDMYYKAGNMIHMIRQVINDDEKFRNILRGLNKKFYHKTITGHDVETYINKESGINFSSVFNQYLRTTNIPVLEYKTEKGKIYFRWKNAVDGFTLPVKMIVGTEFKHPIWFFPRKNWTKIRVPKKASWSIDRNFLVELKKLEE